MGAKHGEGEMTHSQDVAQLVAWIDDTIGEREWVAPDGYPSSLALCVLDSVWSLGVHYNSVVNVISKYRSLRAAAGANAETDGASELVGTFSEIGDAVAVAERLGNRQRTSSTNGVLKAQAVRDVAELLVAHDCETASDLVELSKNAERSAELKKAWRKITGPSSGLSLTYCRMLAGAPDAKADRMVVAFVEEALEADDGTGDSADRRVSQEEARRLVTAAAEQRGEDTTDLDHMIWRFQSGRV